MTWEYSEKTKQLFMDAVHGVAGTHMGEIDDADGFGEHGSIACGDALRFTFRCERHPSDPLQDRIVEARYLTFGCTSAIAASEALCVIIETGRFSPVQALGVSNQDIVDFLGGLPEAKIHCSVMGAEALEAAVFNWAQKRGVDLEALGLDMTRAEQEEGRLVCKCFGVTEPYLRRKIKELGLRSIPEITNAIKAGGACMACHHAPGGLQDILNDIWGRQPTSFVTLPSVPVVAAKLRPPRWSLLPTSSPSRWSGCSSEDVRPRLKDDGGDLEIVDIKEMTVYCRLSGACAHCGGAASTMKLLVERLLKERVDERIRVIAV